MYFDISSCSDVDVPNNSHQYIETKLQHFKEKYPPNLHLHIRFSKENYLYGCNIVVNNDKHYACQSHGESHDVLESFNMALHKLKRHLDKYKQKHMR